jgi:hypothetical protein
MRPLGPVIALGAKALLISRADVGLKAGSFHQSTDAGLKAGSNGTWKTGSLTRAIE